MHCSMNITVTATDIQVSWQKKGKYIWAYFKTCYTPTANLKELCNSKHNPVQQGKVAVGLSQQPTVLLLLQKLSLLQHITHSVWVTCDICLSRDRYFLQGSKLASIMLISCHSWTYDYCCVCQWVLPDTPGAWQAWRWWWESSSPVWWWWSPPRSLNAHTPDQERTKDEGLLLWLNPIGTSHEAAQLIHRGCLHFALALHFVFLHYLFVI